MSRTTLVALLLVLCAVVAAPAQAHSDKPSRVVLIMLDQARPDTIERYDMDNVKALMRRGASFPNALVGHMAAETVISHSVLTSGLFPKNMGWSNEVHRDVDGVLGTPGDYYVTSSLSCSQFQALTEAGQYRRLADYPGRQVRLRLEVRLDRAEAHRGLPGGSLELGRRRRHDRPRGLHLPDPRQLELDRL